MPPIAMLIYSSCSSAGMMVLVCPPLLYLFIVVAVINSSCSSAGMMVLVCPPLLSLFSVVAVARV
jgi:hypothetical protein